MLKVGLEIHTQLKTNRKLFALSKNTTSLLDVRPNTTTSFFDVSLPGTQPKLNKEPLMYALKTALALNCTVKETSQFDRKHYFYGDQPLGYQITQHYHPIAKDGYLRLTKYDLPEEKTIRIEQLQIEQDTGRTLYKLDNESNVDFNRSNIPLIEMVTKPDFSSVEEVRAFIKKLQQTLVNLDVCTGELETGAIRVDVNLSVDDHSRIEIKNLPTTSAIVSAIKYEYQRQCNIIKTGGAITEVETRGWSGKKTYKLRSKENAIDYRYMPDPELPEIKLDLNDIVPKIQAILPPSVDQKLDQILNDYKIKLRDANILMGNHKLMDYYKQLYNKCSQSGVENPINWLTHELLGCLSKSNMDFEPSVMDVDKFVELMVALKKQQVTKNNAKLLLMHLVNNPQDQNIPIAQLINDFDLSKTNHTETLDPVLDQVLSENAPVVAQIVSGKTNKLKYLLGLTMRATEGKFEPKLIEEKLKERLLNL
ncbi:hypothetical protein OGAPHI_005481 [Ogataea philodendri]|uniref:Glutamyl-tRNA(Gln) amidotransferase subunit B, mitochondrial n=1 Tax=Ogataea philodendri TaxID=1378263 RepID=A0A9P8NYH1_9ASCO|nr:uncharacterized protein OGAPHI_005481 [Ogataea philodendri]KAH3662233.1 hypothetical protein OGAPHI_005481 [Ogataea philodendri]